MRVKVGNVSKGPRHPPTMECLTTAISTAEYGNKHVPLSLTFPWLIYKIIPWASSGLWQALNLHSFPSVLFLVKEQEGGLPWWSVVKTPPSNVGGTGSIIGYDQHACWPKIQKQYCNKFYKDWKRFTLKKNLKRKKWEGFLKVSPHLNYFLRSTNLKVGYRMLKSMRLKLAEWRIIILNGNKEPVDQKCSMCPFK